jgi:hypothetical protein
MAEEEADDYDNQSSKLL